MSPSPPRGPLAFILPVAVLLTVAAVVLLLPAGALSRPPPPCPARPPLPLLSPTTFFFLPSLAEIEAERPALARCGLTKFAAAAQAYLSDHPLRTDDPAHATLAVFPLYLAWETNWPVYGGWFTNNSARQGKFCRHVVVDAARALADAQRLPVLLYDSMPTYDFLGHVPRGAPDPYRDPRLIWARLNALDKHHRPGWDIAYPPPMTDSFARLAVMPEFRPGGRHLPARLPGTAAPARASAVFSDPDYAHFLVFRGNLANHPVRGRIRNALLASGGGRLPPGVIYDSGGPGTEGDHARMLSSSVFALAPRGDVEFSYRFTEVACSGAVPVLVADGWVPPLEPLAPFFSYGVRIAESDADLGGMMDRLRGIYERGGHAVMREAALRFCHRHAVTVYRGFDAVVGLAMRTAAANGTAAGRGGGREA
ncbi:hypothetical protein DFJ74DRAFT_771676 [Hyaloraphidium curvatum]|nr:hypothetical protein DFJ74DRAFT_771676 [Hyaloraphidium curvatum]